MVQYDTIIRMRRSRVTITLNQSTLDQVDNLIDHKSIRNRSHAIEFALNHYLRPKVHKAVILAGGTSAPKTLLLIKGKPIVEHLIRQLKDNGVTEIIFCINQSEKRLKQYFGDGEKFGVKIEYSEEKEQLQTGGALLQVKKRLDKETFLVVHGDILTNISFADLIEFHEKEDSVVTLALAGVNQPSEFGQLKLHGSRLVNFFQSTTQENIQSHLINSGIYVCDPSVFNFVPKNKTAFLFEDVIAQLIKEKKVTGFVFSGQWYDVGNTANYELAVRDFSE